MNDYILYNELGRGAHTVVYKGRKKGHIDFVAICSYEKEFQDYVNNKVSILSQTKHPNVVEFYQWYETSSHFWIIEELCNGCSLAMATAQDSPVSESLVKNCAVQLTKALYHIHSTGVIVRNLHPHKILIDSKGGLKIGGLLMGCDLNKSAEENVVPALSPLYCCPEALFDNTWSYVSDLWSLGAILYHMYTGHEPFMGETMEEITEGIRAEEERRREEDKLIPISTEKEKHLTLPGTGVDGKPLSNELHSLLSGLLDPNPDTRLNWMDLEKHPFFRKSDDLVNSSFFESERNTPDDMKSEFHDSADITDSLNKTITLNDNKNNDNNNDNTNISKDNTNINKDNTNINKDNDNSKDNKDNSKDALDTAPNPSANPKTSSTSKVSQSLNLNSSTATLKSSVTENTNSSTEIMKPTTADNINSSTQIMKPTTANNINSSTQVLECSPSPVDDYEIEESIADQLTLTESMVQMPELSIQRPPIKKPSSATLPAVTPRLTLDTSLSVDSLLKKYQANMQAQPIVGNTKIFKEAIHMRCDVRQLPWEALANEVLVDCEGSAISHHLVEVADFLGKKGSTTRELLNSLGYIYTLTNFENCVYLIVNSELLLSLVHLVKGTSEDVQLRIVQVIGALIQNSTTIEQETHLGECVSVLTDVLRDSSRSLQLRLYTLASLGELIFFIASQEETDGINTNWNVPTSTSVCITRCLREGEEIATQLCAAKIIENVCTVVSRYSKLFSQDHVALYLWKLHTKQAPTDLAHMTFVRALTNVTIHHYILLTHVIAKIGLVNVVDNLRKSTPVLQKEILLFILHGLNTEKLNATCKRIISDKALLSLAITLTNTQHSLVKSFSALLIARLLTNNDTLTLACNQKLVQNLDRELKRGTEEYLVQCLSYLSSVVLSFVAGILDQVENILKKVENRRNPNTIQTKDLNLTLGSLPTVLHLLTSRTLSQDTLAVVNIEQLCDVLRIVPGIQVGDTGLGSGILVEDTLSTIFSISEICLPFAPSHLTVPAVGHLCKCQGDYRGVVVQLGIRITERAIQTLGTEELEHLYTKHILPVIQEMLLETPPLPTLSLRLILPVLDVCQDVQLEDHGIVTALVELMKDCDADDGICLLILETLFYAMSCKTVDFPWLYTLGLPEHLSLLILKLGVSSNVSEQTAVAAVNCLGALLGYIMGVVKKALQTNTKSRGEEILRVSQCVVNTCGVLLVWYHYHPAPPALLSVTQLYGGQYKDFLTPYNVDIFATSLKDEDDTRVKTTLKILKRIITTDPSLVKSMIASTKEQLNKAVLSVKRLYPTLIALSDEVSKLIVNNT